MQLLEVAHCKHNLVISLLLFKSSINHIVCSCSQIFGGASFAEKGQEMQFSFEESPILLSISSCGSFEFHSFL